ncbi:hypothetical protein C8R44DRAFT_893793 [Mycena epipterygia]|nr:hypothetical protein C8R44DRAFT_893793 [Mycena epipterygia]
MSLPLSNAIRIFVLTGKDPSQRLTSTGSTHSGLQIYQGTTVPAMATDRPLHLPTYAPPSSRFVNFTASTCDGAGAAAVSSTYWNNVRFMVGQVLILISQTIAINSRRTSQKASSAWSRGSSSGPSPKVTSSFRPSTRVEDIERRYAKSLNPMPRPSRRSALCFCAAVTATCLQRPRRRSQDFGDAYLSPLGTEDAEDFCKLMVCILLLLFVLSSRFVHPRFLAAVSLFRSFLFPGVLCTASEPSHPASYLSSPTTAHSTSRLILFHRFHLVLAPAEGYARICASWARRDARLRAEMYANRAS